MIFDHQIIVTCIKALVNAAPQFSEVGETCSTHPDNEMLLLHVLPLDVFPSLSDTVFVRWWFQDVFELVLDIRAPSDSFLLNIDHLV